MTKRERIKFKELKRQNTELLMSIWLFWMETYGFFEDGYQRPKENNHPLYPYFPTKGQTMTKTFRQRAKAYRKALGNQS